MTGRVRSVATIGLAVGAVVAVALGASADEPMQVTQAVRVTHDDPNPARSYATPMIAIDPDNPRNVASVAAEIRSRGCGFARSTDSGRTWTRPDASPALDGYPFCFQTETGPPQGVLTFGSGGALYYAYPGWAVEDTDSGWPMGRGGGWKGNVSVVVSRSDDLGETWQKTLARDARGRQGEDQENNRPVSSIVVDRSGDRDIVYVAWEVSYRTHNRPVMAASTDAGATFSEPVDLTGGYFDDEDNRRHLAEVAGEDEIPGVEAIDFSWPDLTVAGDGTLYAVWAARMERGPQLDRSGTYLSRSTDGGRTFEVVELSPAPDVFYYPQLAWSPAGGPDGTVHLVYEQQGPQGAQWVQDIFHSRSTDAGVTWTDPVMLNDDDPQQYVGQFHPNIAIAPDGRVDVAWWDFRNDQGAFSNDVYLVSSDDNGDTWSANVRVTDRSISRLVGVWYGNADIRQAPGLAATDEMTVVAWDDTRNNIGEVGTQDIYSAAVQYAPLGPDVNRNVQITLAATVGLAIAGLVLLLLGVVRRGGRADAGRAPKQTAAVRR